MAVEQRSKADLITIMVSLGFGAFCALMAVLAGGTRLSWLSLVIGVGGPVLFFLRSYQSDTSLDNKDVLPANAIKKRKPAKKRAKAASESQQAT